MRSIRVSICVDAKLRLGFLRRAQRFDIRPSQVLRALLRAYVEGGRPPSSELVDSEYQWQRTIQKDVAARRNVRLYVRLDEALHTRLLARVEGRRNLSPTVRAILREFCSNQRDISGIYLEQEQMWERTRLQVAQGRPKPKRQRRSGTSRINRLLDS